MPRSRLEANSAPAFAPRCRCGQAKLQTSRQERTWQLPDRNSDFLGRSCRDPQLAADSPGLMIETAPTRTHPCSISRMKYPCSIYLARQRGRGKPAIWQFDSATNGASIILKGKPYPAPDKAFTGRAEPLGKFRKARSPGMRDRFLVRNRVSVFLQRKTSRWLDCRAHYLHIPAHTSAQVRRVASKLISDISGTKQVPSVTCSIPPSCYGSRTKVLLTGRDWQGILDCGATFTSVLPRAVRSSVRSFDFRMLLLKAS